MSIERVQKKLTTGLFVIPTCILLTFLIRIHSGINLLDPANIAVLLIQIAISLAFLRVNHAFSVIRARTILPAVVYLLIACTDARSFTDLNSAIASICFLLALVCSFSSYQCKESQTNLFNVTLLLAGGSLLWMPLILLLPVFWWIFIHFHALSMKSIIASFLGLFVVSLCIASYSVYKDDLSVIHTISSSYSDFLPLKFRVWDTLEIIRVCFTGVLILFSFLHFQKKLYAEKIKTRAFLYVLYTFIFILAVCLIFSDTGSNEIISILHLVLALLIAHYFTLSQSKFTSYVVLISIFFYVIMYFCIHYQYLFDKLKWTDSIFIF